MRCGSCRAAVHATSTTSSIVGRPPPPPPPPLGDTRRTEMSCEKNILGTTKGTSTRMWLRPARTIIKSTMHSGKSACANYATSKAKKSYYYFRFEGELQFTYIEKFRIFQLVEKISRVRIGIVKILGYRRDLASSRRNSFSSRFRRGSSRPDSPA